MSRDQRTHNFLPNIRCALLDTSKMIGDDDISNYMRSLTMNFLRNNYSYHKYPIYEADNVDKILNDIEEQETEPGSVTLLVVQSYGNILYDAWTPVEHGWSLFRDYCNFDFIKRVKTDDFLLMGHILDDTDKDRWFRVHEQCFVINLLLWRKLGKPKFGDFTYGKPTEVVNAVRSEDNFHDSHTPKFLDPPENDETITLRRTGLGWNFIDVSLRNGIRVQNFDEQVRTTKLYLYPEIKSEQEEFKKYFREGCASFKAEDTTTLGKTKIDFLNYQQFTVERSPHAMWIFNTETVNDITMIGNKKPLLNLYTVAAGFKTFGFLRNWHPETDLEKVNLTYFDISNNALDVRRWVHEEWNPQNFNQYLDFLYENYYNKDKGLISMYEDFNYASDNWDDEREKANEVYKQSVLRIFQNMNEFYDMMEKLRDKEINYVQANMIRDYSALTNAIQPDVEGYDSVLWSSNYITTRYCTWILSSEERENVYKKSITDFYNKNPKLRVHSTDWDGAMYRGLTTEELYGCYKRPKHLFEAWRKIRT